MRFAREATLRPLRGRAKFFFGDFFRSRTPNIFPNLFISASRFVFQLLRGLLVLFFFSALLRAQATEAPTIKTDELPEIRIGYIEASFSPSERKAFAHTFLYLSATLPQYRFTIRPYLVKDLETAVRTKSIDFFLAASGFYRRLNYRGLRDLATLVTPTTASPDLAVGTVFLVKKEAPYRTFDDLKGLRAAANWEEGFTGVYVPMGEIAAGGHTYIAVLEEALAKYPDRVKVLLETNAAGLIEENGRVTGVAVESRGKTAKVFGTRGVILSTGGFGANVEFRQKVNTGIWKEANLDKEIGCSNISVAAQGDGLLMAEKVNADLIGLADIQVHPNGTPGTGLMLDIKTSGRNRLFINTNGDRFVDEGAPRDVLSKAVFAQPGQTFWLVQNHLRYPDENKIDLLSGRTMHDMLEQGRVQKADTLEDLAKIMKVDVNRLRASIEEYNRVARHEVETDRFGFRANHTDDRPITEGPYYVARKVPTIHHTMGGIKINTRAEVIDREGKVIPGLYAAGEVTGGVHGENRLGGNAVADCMVFGRTAGRMAAENK